MQIHRPSGPALPADRANLLFPDWTIRLNEELYFASDAADEPASPVRWNSGKAQRSDFSNEDPWALTPDAISPRQTQPSGGTNLLMRRNKGSLQWIVSPWLTMVALRLSGSGKTTKMVMSACTGPFPALRNWYGLVFGAANTTCVESSGRSRRAWKDWSRDRGPFDGIQRSLRCPRHPDERHLAGTDAVGINGEYAEPPLRSGSRSGAQRRGAPASDRVGYSRMNAAAHRRFPLG